MVDDLVLFYTLNFLHDSLLFLGGGTTQRIKVTACPAPMYEMINKETLVPSGPLSYSEPDFANAGPMSYGPSLPETGKKLVASLNFCFISKLGCFI